MTPVALSEPSTRPNSKTGLSPFFSPGYRLSSDQLYMNRSLLGTSTAQLVLRSASLVPRPLPDFEWPGDEATDPPSPKDAYFRSLLDLPDIIRNVNNLCGYYAVAIPAMEM